jgi:hypothetical protein
MGLDLVVASTSCAWAASCSVSRHCALFSTTVEVSIGLGVYVATLRYLAGGWTQSKPKGRCRDSIIGARAAGHERC